MSEQYTFELKEGLVREHAAFPNRYGITIAADLYYAKNIDKNSKYPAIVVGPPYSECKEQGTGVYANVLAWRGFVVLAVDPPYFGESGGEPRFVSSPELYSETFSAGVDYLGVLEADVDSIVDAKTVSEAGAKALH